MRDLLLEHGAPGDVEKHQHVAEEAPKSAAVEAPQRTTKASSATAADSSEEPLSPRAADEGEKAISTKKLLRHRTPRKNEDESGTTHAH
jgi:hypothetical protein